MKDNEKNLNEKDLENVSGGLADENATPTVLAELRSKLALAGGNTKEALLAHLKKLPLADKLALVDNLALVDKLAKKGLVSRQLADPNRLLANEDDLTDELAKYLADKM